MERLRCFGVVGIEDRDLESLDLLAVLQLPDPHPADAVAAGRVLAVGGDRDGVQRRDVPLRRLRGVAFQRVDQLAGIRFPDLDQHVIAGRNQPCMVGRGDEVSHPALVGLDTAGWLTLFHVPPDEPAVVAAGDEQRLRVAREEGQGRDVIVVPGPAGDGFLLLGGQVEDVDAVILAARVEAVAGKVGAQAVEGGPVGVGDVRLAQFGRIDLCHGRRP